jgi:hypothetical protein|tara:strand:- start:2703 stop:3281 length:579 start_codon:yes stop_codon:yes gene_type:complete
MSLKLKNTEKYLKAYSKKLFDYTVVEIARKDRTRNYQSGAITSSISASGDLQRSLRFHQSKKNYITSFNIIGNEYGEFVDEGTRRSNPPVSKLIDWLQTKNTVLTDKKGNTINLYDLKKVKRIAYAIKKSLNRKGIKRTNYLTDIVKKEFRKLNNIHNPVVKDIMSDLDNILKNAGYEKKGNETFTIETKVI